MTTCPSDRPSTATACRPTPAERARTVALRPGATVCAPGVEGSRVLAHAVTASGRVVLVVPADGELATAVRDAPDQDLSALVMVSDHAPVPLRRPVRAQLWLSGWVTPVRAEDVRQEVLAFADTRPDPALLDVGHGAALLRLDLAEVVLGEGGPGIDVGPQEFLAARPDPLAGIEAETLRHLDDDHPEVLVLLRGLLPPGTAGPGDRVRPLGVDRFGYRLRVERAGGHLDVRVPFPAPVSCAGQLAVVTQRLLSTARARRAVA